MNKEIRKLTDGAMMAAIIGVLLLINRQTAGLLESFLLFAFPLPMVFYGAKYGWKASFMVLAAIAVLCFIIGTPQTWFYVLSESLIGVVYGCGVYHKTPTRTIVMRTVIMAVVADVLSMLVFAKFFGYDLTGEVKEYKTAIDQVTKTNGVSMPSTLNIDNMLKTMIILSTVLTGVMEGIVTHLLSRLMLKRLRFHLPPMTPVSEYFPPKWSGYLGMAGLIAYAVSVYRPLADSTQNMILAGVGMAGVFYLAIYGMICMSMTFTRHTRSKGIAVVLSIILLLFMSMAVAFLGFLYISTDMHARMIETWKEADHASENH